MKYVQDYAEVFASRLQPDQTQLKFPAGGRGRLILFSVCISHRSMQPDRSDHDIDAGDCSEISSVWHAPDTTAGDQAIRRRQVVRVAGFCGALLLVSGVVTVAVDHGASLKGFASLSNRSAAAAPGSH
jgi:hypothetical protein